MLNTNVNSQDRLKFPSVATRSAHIKLFIFRQEMLSTARVKESESLDVDSERFYSYFDSTIFDSTI